MNTKQIICVDSAEARLMRKKGYCCVTSAKFRNLILRLLESGAENAPQVALEAVKRIDGVSSADSPSHWAIWDDNNVKQLSGYKETKEAIENIPTIDTPLHDPDNPIILEHPSMWKCEGTTVLIAKDTFDLVRVADTYAKYDCYRPHGRMDEPFVPESGRVCLITENELRLLRPENDDICLVLTYYPEHQCLTGMVATHSDSDDSNVSWPTSIRVLCAEFSNITVGIAGYLVEARHGEPFFLGLTRGVGYETSVYADTASPAALAWRIQTNTKPTKAEVRIVAWAGGDDVRQLVNYGGLTIFTGRDSRRKVQLRSLGLIRNEKLAGAYIYDLACNFETLTKWATTRTFSKLGTSQRERNKRRVRCKKALHEYARGTYIYITSSPWRIHVTPKNQRISAKRLKEINIIKKHSEDGGVSTVHLGTLGNDDEGAQYWMNGKGSIDEEGNAFVDSKRCIIRCPRWKPADSEGIIEWLKACSCVAICGTDNEGCVWAVVRVANGTEDQQCEATKRWAEDVGRRFPRGAGCSSLVAGSMDTGSSVVIEKVIFTNWTADRLETAQYEPYQSCGEYSKALKIKRGGTATPSERADRYIDKVELANDGTRNSRLVSALYNMIEHFGADITESKLPKIMERSTLSTAEKQRIVNKVFRKTQNNKERGKVLCKTTK